MSENPKGTSHSKVSASQILIRMRADSAEDTSPSHKDNHPPTSSRESTEHNLSASSKAGNTQSSKISTSTTDNNVDLNHPTSSAYDNVNVNQSPSPTQDVDESKNSNNSKTNSPQPLKDTVNRTTIPTQVDINLETLDTSTQENVQEENSTNSSDDEIVNSNSLQPIIYDDDLIFDKDEDAKSIEETPNEQYHPSTDHYRRIFLNSSTKIPTNNLFDGLINNQFIPEEFKMPKQWEKTYKKSYNFSGIVNSIMLIRKRNVDRKKKASNKVDIGYRFPFKQVLDSDDRFEMIELGSKYYMSDDKTRIPYVWLHYYPPNQNKGNSPIKDFFKSIFPSESDNELIELVHEHHRTECIAIGLHDKKFENLQYGYTDRCHILAAVSFCLLKNDSDLPSGAYIYYLGTLPEIGFHEILPNNKVMKEMKFLVEGNGFAPKLIRII